MRITRSRRARWLLGACCVALAALTVGAGIGLAGGSAAKTQLIVLEDDIAPALDLDGASAAHPGLEEMNINLMEPLIAYPSHKAGDILVPNYKVGPTQFQPRLATSWTKNGLTWTFKLRHGVKSCAGNELTADDVIWTAARAKSVSGAAPVGWFLGNVAGVFPLDPVLPKATAADKQLKGEVVKVDKYTVRFKQLHQSELFPRVLEIFASWIFDSTEVKKHVTASDPWAHTWINTVNTPGFGPYCLKKWAKGSEIQLAANPNYYRGQPQYKTIIIRKVPQNANRVAAIQSGAADIATNLTPQEYKNLAQNQSVKVLSRQNTKIMMLGLSFNFDPWKGPKNRPLRQAIANAIPYDAIIKQDFLGNARPWYGLCESSYFGYTPIKSYTTNLAKAKQLMAQAGYPDGKGLPSKGLVLSYVAERRSLLEPIVNRIRTSLAQIGVNITLNPLPFSEFIDRRLTKYDMPMFLDDQDRPLGPDVGYCSLLFWVSKKNGGLNTPSAYDNPQFDALYKKSTMTVGATRLNALHQMQQTLMRDLPEIPIAEPASQLAVRKEITNWQVTTYDILSFFEFKST